MSRICILGNAGGGKSTLARSLAQKLGIKHIEIDALYWRPDWAVAPPEEYERQHAEAIQGDKWVIDGGGALESIPARLDRATAIILIDMPLWAHYWLAAERQIAWATGEITDGPGGNTAMPPTGRLFEIIWEADRDWLPDLRQQCDAEEAKGKTVTRLMTLDALNEFSRSIGSRTR